MKPQNIFIIISFLITTSIFSQPFTKKYLMAFHTCGTNCTDPRNHNVRLAESNDGVDWTLVPNFQTYSGSVPDVTTRGSKLYIYNAGNVTIYDRDTNTWLAQTTFQITDTSGTVVQATDPSLFIDDQGRINLFFLNSTGSTGDPAGCSSYPCNKIFDSAIEVSGSDGTSFIAQSNHRASIELNAGVASDPDIFFDGTTYFMYISMGQTSVAYSSDSLHGSYELLSSLPNGVLTDQGGVPCGYYDPITNKYWTYISKKQVNGNVDINLAVHDNFNSQLSEVDFTTVITGESIGLDSWVYAESPGFCINGFLDLPQLPSQVQLVSPPNNSEISETSVTFIWNTSTPDVTQYWFESSDSSNFVSSKIDTSITDTSVTHIFELTGEQYWWRVKAKNNVGWGEFSEVWKFSSIITNVENFEHPNEYALFQNYPNPFNPTTIIKYSVPGNGETTRGVVFATFKIYDIVGREVATIVNETKEPGIYEVEFDGSKLKSGIYFYRIISETYSETRKMVLLR